MGNKHLTWQLLRQLRRQCNPPLVFFGDFNEIVSLEEKEGGGPSE